MPDPAWLLRQATAQQDPDLARQAAALAACAGEAGVRALLADPEVLASPDLLLEALSADPERACARYAAAVARRALSAAGAAHPTYEAALSTLEAGPPPGSEHSEAVRALLEATGRRRDRRDRLAPSPGRFTVKHDPATLEMAAGRVVERAVSPLRRGVAAETQARALSLAWRMDLAAGQLSESPGSYTSRERAAQHEHLVATACRLLGV